MRVKLFFGGESLNIPKTDIGLAYSLISVWIDGNGFTSAANSIGSLGYVCFETEAVDLGDVDPTVQQLFSNLHATVVHYDITTNLFVKDGGIAKVVMTVSTQDGANLADHQLVFQASACRGVSVISNPISFSCEMLQLPASGGPVALADDGNVLSDDATAGLAANSPGAGADQSADATAAA